MLPGRTYTPLDFAEMAWRRRWWMLAGLLVGIYAALVVSSRLVDLFQSEMLIQVIPQRVPDSYVQSTVTMRTEDRLNALSQQVLSRTALEGLITEMNLYVDRRGRLPMQDVVDLMRLDVKVEPVTSNPMAGGGADAFYVRFTYTDRDVATRVTEKLGLLFIDLNAKDRGQLAAQTDEFLESQLAERKAQLEALEQKLEQFRQRNAGRLPTQLESNMQTIQNTQMGIQALVDAIARDRDQKLLLERLYSDAELELKATALRPQPPKPTSDEKPGDGTAAAAVPAAQQLIIAREALARLQLRLTPEHPDVGRAKRIIAELEVRAAEEASAAKPGPDGEPVIVAEALVSPEVATRRERLRQSRAEIDSLERRITHKEAEETRLREVLASYHRRIEEIPGVESEWVALTRDYDTQQAAYKSLLAKSEQSKVAVELERRQIGEQFRVLDAARPPVRPTGVNRLQVNALGAAAGLALGLALAALLEFRDRTFRSARDVHDVLQLPIIAHVPYVMLDSDRRQQQRVRLMMSATVVLITVAAGYGFWAMQLWKFVV